MLGLGETKMKRMVLNSFQSTERIDRNITGVKKCCNYRIREVIIDQKTVRHGILKAPFLQIPSEVLLIFEGEMERERFGIT